MSQLNYQPLGDRVIVEPQTPEQTTKSGIVLPDSAKEKPVCGVVLAVGPGKTSDEGKLIPVSVKVGDTVLYSKSATYSAAEIKENGKEYLIIRESDVLAIKKI